jgi:hypothetical protein
MCQNSNFLFFNLKVIAPFGLRYSESQPGTDNYEIIISQLIHIIKNPGFLIYGKKMNFVCLTENS